MTLWAPLVFIFVAITAWLLRYRRRQLMTPSEILKELHPHETDSIETFAPRETFDYLTDDKEFWAASKGWDGLRRKRHNAIRLVHFCQSLKPDINMEEEELRLMLTRAILIHIYTGCSLLESPARWFIQDFPHSFARNATNLYWDMERRATTLCSVYRPDLLDQLHQIL